VRELVGKAGVGIVAWGAGTSLVLVLGRRVVGADGLAGSILALVLVNVKVVLVGSIVGSVGLLLLAQVAGWLPLVLEDGLWEGRRGGGIGSVVGSCSIIPKVEVEAAIVGVHLDLSNRPHLNDGGRS
jgi:hypothetical protein